MGIEGVILHTSMLETACKITLNERLMIGTEHHTSFSFGMGKNKFCMTGSNKKQGEFYIDRVERNDLCVVGGKISDKGTDDLVHLALYFIKTRMPSIERFTLQDDSHVFCIRGATSGRRISILHESILKYNQTWYQDKCHACLPGMVHRSDEPFSPSPHCIVIPSVIGVKTEDGIMYRTVYYEVERMSMMHHYLESLQVLDQPSLPYDNAVDHFPTLARYKEDYVASSTPRRFMARLRGRLSIEQYCMEVNGWVEGYMKFLDVKIAKDFWYIPTEAIERPTGYSEKPMAQARIHQIFGGGRLRSRRSTLKSEIRRGYSIGSIHDL